MKNKIKPTELLLDIINQAEKDLQDGNVFGPFEVKEFLKSLEE